MYYIERKEDMNGYESQEDVIIAACNVLLIILKSGYDKIGYKFGVTIHDSHERAFPQTALSIVWERENELYVFCYDVDPDPVTLIPCSFTRSFVDSIIKQWIRKTLPTTKLRICN